MALNAQILPSTGTTDDRSANALAEAVNVYNTQLLRWRGLWQRFITRRRLA